MESVAEEHTAFLLDTHVLLWWLFDDPKLSRPAYQVIQTPENTILVSSATGWEISTKYRLGKLPHAGEAFHNLPDLLRKAHMEVMPVTMEHALTAGGLPGPHRDPFDRMLIAQWQLECIPIVTTDPAFRHYPVELVW